MGEGFGLIDGCARGALSVTANLAALRRRSLTAVVAVLAVLLLCSAHAYALSQRGHVPVAAPNGSFGAGGQGKAGEEPPTRASAIAVNEAASGEGAGDVYVVERSNNRVTRFGPAPEHKFIEAWGFGVATGAEEFQKCTTAKGCRSGIAGFNKEGQLSAPVAIAVDSSASSTSEGDVYVVANDTAKKGIVDKFNFEGKLIGTLKTEEAEGSIDGVAVDSAGTVWVDREDGEEDFLLEHYSDELKNKELGEATELEVPEEVEGTRPTRPGFAVDGSGNLYITYEPGGKSAEALEEEEDAIAEREKERKKKGEPPADETPQQPCEKNPCLVAKLATVPGPAPGTLEAETLIPALDLEDTAGLAVDPTLGRQSSGDVYLNNVTSVAGFNSAGSLIQHFGEGQLEGHGSGLALDARTGEVLAGIDTGVGKIDVFELEKAGPPTAEAQSVFAANVTASSAKLGVTIDPSGLDTRYGFRYGTGVCTGTPSPCREVLAKETIGPVFEELAESVEVTGLSPSTTYHFLAFVENAAGGVVSEERTFTTRAANATEAPLPDGRAWELVSPVEKHGAAIEPIRQEGGLIEASGNGHRITYLASAPAGNEEPAGNRGPEPTQLISTRVNAGEWSEQDLNAATEAAQGIPGGERLAYQAFSTDLSLGVFFPVVTEPLAERRISLRETEKCATCSVPVAVTGAGSRAFQAATPDLQHIVLNTSKPLISGLSEKSSLYEWNATEEQHEEGHFRLVSVLEGGEQDPNVDGLQGGGVEEGNRNRISANGQRIVWQGEPHLYQDELVKGKGKFKSTQIDTPDTGVTPPAGQPGPLYQDASVSGAKVFFTDNQSLTNDASMQTERTGDLYVYEPEKAAGERVTDLTPDPHPAEPAAVQGGVLGVSEDGSYVYFVANGVLSENANDRGEKAKAGACQYEGLRTTTCNLYVVHYDGESGVERWEAPRFIAELSNEDGPDWGATASNRLQYGTWRMTARVSPNGRYLAFMSDRALTGYNNTDANSGQPDEEVYLYDYDASSGAGHVTCASCNPSGARPVGVHDVEESGEGSGLLVDRPGIWSAGLETGFDHWLAASVPGWTALDQNEAMYQSRYLSDAGRLFFDGADALVSLAHNGKEDVYEYEPTSVGGCGSMQSPNSEGGCVALISSGASAQESAFVDASESGNDVFFVTSEKLSPKDSDNAFDLYDARVCNGPGAEGGCPPSGSSQSSECKNEGECKGTVAVSPSTGGAPASSVASGSGNIVQQGGVLSHTEQTKPKPLTKKQLLEKALTVCKKDKSKSKRLACEKQARKKYGPSKKAKKSNRKSGSTAGASSRTRR